MRERSVEESLEAVLIPQRVKTWHIVYVRFRLTTLCLHQLDEAFVIHSLDAVVIDAGKLLSLPRYVVIEAQLLKVGCLGGVLGQEETVKHLVFPTNDASQVQTRAGPDDSHKHKGQG